MAFPIIVSDEQVKNVITWKLVNEAVEESFKAICYKTRSKDDKDQPFSDQPTRSKTFTEDGTGLLFTMPGYVGNYEIGSKKYNTLGCKMVTMFKDNEQRNPPLPSILASIALFSCETGQLECVIDGTEITARRTASASIVATKYLFFKRKVHVKNPVLAIIGCGVQGKSHSGGFCETFNLSEVNLWNRTVEKALDLQKFLENEKTKFVNPNIKINVIENIEDCVKNADIIVTSTYVEEPIIDLKILKNDVHINAVGCGPNSHHSELSQDVYDKCNCYIDHWAGANVELKDLKTNMAGEVGTAIIDEKKIPKKGITVFQSLGMAVEDVTVAQSIYEALKNK